MAVVNLGMGRHRGDAEDPRRRGRGASRRHALAARARRATWSYDAERYAQVTALRRAEQQAMAAFGADGRCLMRVLQEELDDPAPARLRSLLGLHRAAVRRAAGPGAGRAGRPPPALDGRSSSRSRRWRPTPPGVMRKIPDDVRIEPGWALARFGDGGWWPAVERGLRRRAIRRRGRRRRSPTSCDAPAAAVRWITTVPSAAPGRRDRSRLGDAPRRRARSRSRYVQLVTRTEDRPPQREMANAAQQVANVRGAFRVDRQAARRARASCSTTAAARAGRWRWSAASCAAPAPQRIVPLALGTLQ